MQVRAHRGQLLRSGAALLARGMRARDHAAQIRQRFCILGVLASRALQNAFEPLKPCEATGEMPTALGLLPAPRRPLPGQIGRLVVLQIALVTHDAARRFCGIRNGKSERCGERKGGEDE